MTCSESISVPNQRHIITHKARSKRGEYTQINLPANRAAMDVLTYKTYKLYMYLCYNADAYPFHLYKALLKSALPKNSYYRAFDELVEKGYLVRRGESNSYDFYEDPANKDPVPDPVTTCTHPGDEVSPNTVQKTHNRYTHKDKTRSRPPTASGKSAFDDEF